MTDDAEKDAAAPRPPAAKMDREARLAAALRANLRRRKDRGRAQAAAAKAAPEDGGPEDGGPD